MDGKEQQYNNQLGKYLLLEFGRVVDSAQIESHGCTGPKPEAETKKRKKESRKVCCCLQYNSFLKNTSLCFLFPNHQKKTKKVPNFLHKTGGFRKVQKVGTKIGQVFYCESNPV